ncbi:LD-carboxypeptidase [Rossellomorea aquimaris]|uniref:S66 family peptidase n=1 Tax=Rossellomorea aquimaris TaxID=189382 RepID=UPI001CD7AB7A|nr:S66 peptidase family protein [Rossellomorea aquimaris]MCA1053794.1 LD-carboxypeptidase [Rossellomorea aquimaris]
MITYPVLKERAGIGVTAPSSGVPTELHHLLEQSKDRFVNKGYSVSFGDTAWKQEKVRSSSAEKRAAEFMEMMEDDSIEIIIPPWGGELLLEVLPFLDFDRMKEKWILGYSDTSALLFALTLRRGIATAHGTNFVDLRGERWDETTAMWEKVLKTRKGGSITQESSERYQAAWDHANPSDCVFHLNAPTKWKTVSEKDERVCGRLLGGCIDIIHHLAGTPYGNVREFQRNFLEGDSIIWYFENCDMNTTGLRRALLQMNMSGWFEHCSGIMFGRSVADEPVNGYLAEDVYKELSNELGVPVVFDIDCGHQPPQLTLINGAYAEIQVSDGKGSVIQYFRRVKVSQEGE